MAVQSRTECHPYLKKTKLLASKSKLIIVNRIQSIIDAHLVYFGEVSRRQYTWNRAGDIVEVETDDVPELLSKRLGKRLCCGQGNDGNRIFQKMD